MGCGVVMMYLDNLPILAAEYRKNKDGKAQLGNVATVNPAEP
jgi:hypothetical protein